jgi:hypothetical protein
VLGGRAPPPKPQSPIPNPQSPIPMTEIIILKINNKSEEYYLMKIYKKIKNKLIFHLIGIHNI